MAVCEGLKALVSGTIQMQVNKHHLTQAGGAT